MVRARLTAPCTRDKIAAACPQAVKQRWIFCRVSGIAGSGERYPRHTRRHVVRYRYTTSPFTVMSSRYAPFAARPRPQRTAEVPPPPPEVLPRVAMIRSCRPNRRHAEAMREQRLSPACSRKVGTPTPASPTPRLCPSPPSTPHACLPAVLRRLYAKRDAGRRQCAAG